MNIKSYSYNRGIKNLTPKLTNLSSFNELTINDSQLIYIPIKQIKGIVPSIVVSRGEKVKKGTRIAVSGDKVILSSVSGVVEDIITTASVYGGQTEVVVIKNDMKNTQELFKKFNPMTESEDMLKLPLKRFSIVDADGIDLVSKIDALDGVEEKTIVLNMLSDEPYQLNTPYLVATKADEIVDGTLLLVTIMHASKVVVALAKGTENLYSEFLSKLEMACSSLNFSVALLPDKYPLGDEIALVGSLTKKKINNVIEVREAGYLAVDLFSLYVLKKLVLEGEVVVDKPLTIIELNEDNIETSVAWVKVGMAIEDILASINKDGAMAYKKIVAGGPMRGIALADGKASIAFNLKSLMLVKDSMADVRPELPCITCSRCVKVCPVKITPYQIDEHTINGDFNEAVKCGADKCTRCGACSYVCPSKRHLTQRIYYAKEIINSKGLRNE